MIIKMVNEFKLTVVHFARPNPMQICACAWIYRWPKTVENQDWATGPPGCRAVGPPGRWAVAGLLLAKPNAHLLVRFNAWTSQSKIRKAKAKSEQNPKTRFP